MLVSENHSNVNWIFKKFHGHVDINAVWSFHCHQTIDREASIKVWFLLP